MMICLLSYASFAQLFAQTNEEANESIKVDAVKKTLVKVIDERKTASSKDILTNFLNVGIDNLLGDDHKYELDLSFYAISSIFRSKNTTLDYDSERVQKNNSFNISLTGNEGNQIEKIAGGFTFTILDKRDIKSDKFSNGEFDNLIKNEKIVLTIKRGLETYYAKYYPSFFDRSGLEQKKKIDSLWNAAAKNHDFSNIDPIAKKALQSPELMEFISKDITHKFGFNDVNSIKNNILQGGDPLYQEYQKVAKIYAQKPLWTLVPTVAYDRKNKQGEYALASNFTVGLSKLAQKPWEFEIKSQLKIANDSTLTQANYNDKPLSLSVGINKVLLQDKENASRMEFKFFTQYNRQLGTVPTGQNAGLFTLNTTLRINLYKSLWLPITMKYDTDKGNIFGLFTLTANIDN